MIHLDMKKLGCIDGIGHRITGDRTGQSNKRGTGWECLHVAIDDAFRLAYSEILPNERANSAVAFTTRALAWFKDLGVSVERIMTDNGSAYKSFAFRDLLTERGIKHKRTRPYTPRTNGKAERASSRPVCGNGSMPWPMRPRTNRPRRSNRFCSTTIPSAPTAVSDTRHSCSR
jgi:transposase InsO family protein